MNFNTLRYVVAVAKERNFSKAAQSLYVSQPTLSQNIQALEARLGIQLFDRKKYPIMPTHAGKLYIEFAQQVLLSESQINRRITNIAANPRLRLRIGVPPSRSMILMPEIVHAIYLDYPDCLISLEDNKNERELLEMLENTILILCLARQLIMPSNSRASLLPMNVLYLLFLNLLTSRESLGKKAQVFANCVWRSLKTCLSSLCHAVPISALLCESYVKRRNLIPHTP